MKSVAVVVLNWNGWPDIVQCVQSLQHKNHPSLCILHVDNASTGDSVLQLRKSFNDLNVLQSGAKETLQKSRPRVPVVSLAQHH